MTHNLKSVTFALCHTFGYCAIVVTLGDQMAKAVDGKRWGERARQEGLEQGRERILVAAIACYERQGISSTTIEDVAMQAQISRRTVYRYFPSRQAIIQAVVEQQADEFFVNLRRFASQHQGNFRTLLIDCMLFAIEHGPNTPGHKLLLQGTNAESAAQYYLSSKTIIREWQALFAEPFARALALKEIPDTLQLPALLEWMGRLVFSWIQFPAPLEHVRTLIEMLLIPAATD